MKFTLITLLLIFGQKSFSNENPLKNNFYLEVFPKMTKIEELKIEDKVSKEKNNNKIKKITQDNKTIGFIRDINTTTGCESSCHPIVYSMFFNAKGEYLKLKSKEGLTKINHAQFSMEDYSTLELILLMKPKSLLEAKRPEDLTDALSGATLEKYKKDVVAGAAYSSLRILLFYIETESYLKSILNTRNYIETH